MLWLAWLVEYLYFGSVQLHIGQFDSQQPSQHTNGYENQSEMQPKKKNLFCKILSFFFLKFGIVQAKKLMKQKCPKHKIEKKKRPLLWHHRIEQLHM